MASKHCLDALRLPWFEVFLETLDVSREHRPPMQAAADASKAFLEAALSCLRHSLVAFGRTR